MHRAQNFNAGPAALPLEVLQTAAAEMCDYHGTGMSVMEMSHRSKAFQSIIDEATSDLRDLLSIPDNYQALWVQGGGTTQFASVPMNLMRAGNPGYVLTGTWSKKAFKEAKLYGDPVVLGTSEDTGFDRIPAIDRAAMAADADYAYICLNETIGGIAYQDIPDFGDVPLVADASSCFLAEPLDVSRFGLIWAGAQKNVGPAGVTIVIIRDDLIREDVLACTPTLLRYKTMADAGSLYNTPPCWGIYICGLVFKWIKAQGGLEGMAALNRAKAEVLYDVLDSSTLFRGIAQQGDRSIMNVTFTTGDAEGDAAFIKAATEAGFVGVKGHRSVGGMRASIYNAVPLANVRALADFMRTYEADGSHRPCGSGCSSSL